MDSVNHLFFKLINAGVEVSANLNLKI